MCGIAGILRRDAPGADDRRGLAAAMERMRHRGPDDAGSWDGGRVLLGHQRLSILDLTAAGRQPMASGDGRLVVSLNGEIYNYLELRAELGGTFRTGTDTEVLLAAWRAWGPECLRRLRGMFAFAVWDAASDTLFLARDRVGEKPLYWWRDGERLVFASELRALLELVPARPALTPDGVNAFLHYQYVVEPNTLLEGVHRLPPGHLLRLRPGAWDAAPEPWWDLGTVPARDADPVAELSRSVVESVELTLRSDAPVGVALSGGIDSGLIAAIAARHHAGLSAFTVGYPGQRSFDERAQARELAERLGIPWHSVELSTDGFLDFFPGLVAGQDEPVADLAAYGHFAVARLAAEHGVKVLLSGLGGDELFFGYGWVREALRLSQLKGGPWRGAGAGGRAAASLLRAFVRGPLIHVVANRRLPARWREAVDRWVDPGKLDLAHPDEWVFYQLDYHWRPAETFTPQVFSADFRRRTTPRGAYSLMRGLDAGAGAQIAIVRLLFTSWLASNCLTLGDRVSMASSVETRIPLLEPGLIETVVGLWKAGRTEDAGGHKLWLRALAREWLPPEVLDRPKRGFVTPTAEWMDAVNARHLPHLLDGALVQTGVLDGDRLRRWVQRTPPGLHRAFFQYKLTLLEVWDRLVLQGEAPEALREPAGRAA